VFAIFEQFMLNFGHAVTRLTLAMRSIPVGNDFPWKLFLWNIFSRVIYTTLYSVYCLLST
jgi:hypothetical protein